MNDNELYDLLKVAGTVINMSVQSCVLFWHLLEQFFVLNWLAHAHMHEWSINDIHKTGNEVMNDNELSDLLQCPEEDKLL